MKKWFKSKGQPKDKSGQGGQPLSPAQAQETAGGSAPKASLAFRPASETSVPTLPQQPPIALPNESSVILPHEASLALRDPSSIAPIPSASSPTPDALSVQGAPEPLANQHSPVHPDELTQAAETSSLSDTDPWAQAFAKFREREPVLASDYEKHLGFQQDDTTGTTNLSAPRSVEQIVKHLLQNRKEKQWCMTLLNKDINIRDQGQKLVKLIVWAKPIIDKSVSAQPYAALAWSAVALLLPMLTSGTEAMEAMLRGFNVTVNVQVLWNICEQTYLQSPDKGHYQGLLDPLADLYSYVVDYHARVICHLSKAQLSRAWQNVSGATNWTAKAARVQDLSDKCNNLIPHLARNEVRDCWAQQLRDIKTSQTISWQIYKLLEESGSQTQAIYHEQRKKELLQDFASRYAYDKDFNPSRVEFTCDWFFKDRSLQEWRDCENACLLWIFANPGCGKSVLVRALIDEKRLTTNVTTSIICYFFFKSGDETRTESSNALCAILHQLFTQDPTGKLIEHALSGHQNFGRSLTGNFPELWKILLACARSSEMEIICVLDALDECKEESSKHFIEALKTFFHENSSRDQPSKLKFLISSRPYDGLERGFRRFSAVKALRFDGSDKIAEISRDIDRVINARIPELVDGEDLQQKLIKRLLAIEHRTYLWLRLIFEIIDRRQSYFNRASSLEDLISEIPIEVSDAYEQILSKAQDAVATRALLHIMLAAARPLDKDEANVALTLALSKEKLCSLASIKLEMWPEERFDRFVQNISGLFITVHETQLAFIHETARAFLLDAPTLGTGPRTWQGQFEPTESHRTMLRICLDYLNMDEKFPRQFTDSSHFPLYEYSASHWPSHYIEQSIAVVNPAHSACQTALTGSVFSVCDSQLSNFNPWFVRFCENARLSQFPSQPSLIHLMSFLGFCDLVKLLLERPGADVNAKNEEMQTPLHMAALAGHAKVIEVLLAFDGVMVNATTRVGNTPLFTAVEAHRYDAYRQLSAHKDVLINPEQGFGAWGSTLLHAATDRDNGAIFDDLLARSGISPDARTANGSTPLHEAALGGNGDGIRKLLALPSVEVNAANDDGNTPLHFAVATLCYESSALQQLLTCKELNLNARNQRGETPLLRAAWFPLPDAVRQLLEHDETQINAIDKRGRTALFPAVGSVNGKAVPMLLARSDIDINIRDEDGKTALHHAMKGPNPKAITQLLLREDVEVDASLGWTPLHQAALFGNEDMVRDLLSKNQDLKVNTKDAQGKTPLDWASLCDHDEVIELLMGWAEVEVAEPSPWTALHQAVIRDDLEAVRQLLSREDVDVNAVAFYDKTPLAWAVRLGHDQVADLLVAHGADEELVCEPMRRIKDYVPVEVAMASGALGASKP